MASFQAKIGWKMLITPFRSFPTGKSKFQKNSKKIQKIVKYNYGFIPSQNMLERLRKRENKNYYFVSFLPDGQEKIPKK